MQKKLQTQIDTDPTQAIASGAKSAFQAQKQVLMIQALRRSRD